MNAKTKIIGLLGHPVEHSFSPYIHNYLAEKYKLNVNYAAFDVLPERVEDALKGITALGILGCNVTIPHKVAVMSSLDEIDPYAVLMGAVNTIKNEKGQLIGYNTDGIGFVKSITTKGYTLEGKEVVILGAGGSARAIAVELAAHHIKKLTIRNKTIEKAQALASLVSQNFSNVEVQAAPLSMTQEELENVDFLINTTSLGMGVQKDLSPIKKELIPPQKMVACDIVYTSYKTPFLAWATEHHIPIVHGIGMLINQALHSFYIWTGIEVSNDYQEIEKLLREKKLIG